MTIELSSSNTRVILLPIHGLICRSAKSSDDTTISYLLTLCFWDPVNRSIAHRSRWPRSRRMKSHHLVSKKLCRQKKHRTKHGYQKKYLLRKNVLQKWYIYSSIPEVVSFSQTGSRIKVKLLFHIVVLWSAYFAFCTQSSLVQGQKLISSGKLFTDLRAAFSLCLAGLHLWGTNSAILCISSYEGW